VRSSFARFVVVTGLSGAGKSQAMKSFEDLGFACLDNLPPNLVEAYVELCAAAKVERTALALDVRTGGAFGDAASALARLRAGGVRFETLFLDAADDVLVRRFSETRRRHPFAEASSLHQAIVRERAALAELAAEADVVVDTSRLTHGALKMRIAGHYTRESERKLPVGVVAFGFKHGLPVDADLVFDVRFLPNPNYEPDLRELTGLDAPVRAFLEALPATQAFLERLFALIDFLVPLYIGEAKSQLRIAIGCTGGRHRSVYLGDRLAAHLRARDDLAVTFERRDAERV